MLRQYNRHKLRKTAAVASLVATLSMFSVGANAADELPDNLVNLELDAGLVAGINASLPERYQVRADFLNPDYNPNISLQNPSQVGVTFISEGAGYRNTLGYFTYSNDTFSGKTFGDIDINGNGNIALNELMAVDGVDANIIFANSSALGSGGQLRAGDTTVLGGGTASLSDGVLQMNDGTQFDEGTNMGFFVSANAWTGSGVAGWDQGGERNNYFSVDFLNPENSADATFDTPSLNTRHIAMGFTDEDKSQLLIGFEDLNRNTGDNDFNDAVFLVRSDPISGMSGTDVTTFSAPGPVMGGLPALAILACMALWGRVRSAPQASGVGGTMA